MKFTEVSPTKNVQQPPSKPTNAAPKKGMQLVKKKIDTKETHEESKQSATTDELSTAFQQELTKQSEEQQHPAINPLRAPIIIEVIEKINCSLTKEGGLQSFEVIGDVLLQINDPAKAAVVVQMEHEGLKTVTIKPHPQLNKQIWTEKGCLATKDPNQPFPVGSKIPTLKYKLVSTNLQDLPFTFTNWFNEGVMTLEVEYNSSQKRFPRLETVEFGISYPPKESPEVTSHENSDYQNVKNNSMMTWFIPILDSTSQSANIDIKFSAACKVEDLFPIMVNFEANYTA